MFEVIFWDWISFSAFRMAMAFTFSRVSADGISSPVLSFGRLLRCLMSSEVVCQAVSTAPLLFVASQKKHHKGENELLLSYQYEAIQSSYVVFTELETT
jgi:hypothetical protein